MQMFKWGFPKVYGYLFGGPHIEDYSVSGSILGFPDFGKLPKNHRYRMAVCLGFRV